MEGRDEEKVEGRDGDKNKDSKADGDFNLAKKDRKDGVELGKRLEGMKL